MGARQGSVLILPLLVFVEPQILTVTSINNRTSTAVGPFRVAETSPTPTNYVVKIKLVRSTNLILCKKKIWV